MSGMGGKGSSGYGKAGPPGRNDPCENLFVTGLPPEIDERGLRELFTYYGTVVRCKVLPNKGQMDRAGLVEMIDVGQAAWIVNNLNGNTPAGLTSPIKVVFSQSQRGKGAYRQSPYDQPQPGNFLAGLEIKLATHTNDAGNKLWVGQIPLGTSKDVLWHEFTKFGPVQDVYIRDDGKVYGRMWGFITFVDASGANEALNAFQTGAFNSGNQAGGMPIPGGPMPMEQQQQPLQVRPRADNPCKLWVGGIPHGATQNNLRDEFSKVGEVVDVFLKDDGQRTGRLWGFVTMADQSQAQSALTELNGKMLQVAPPAEAQMPAAGGDMQMNQMNGAWDAGAGAGACGACGGSGCGSTNWGYEEPPAMAGVAPPEVPAMAGVAPVAVMGQAQQAPDMTPAPHEQVPSQQPQLDQQVPASETPEAPAAAPAAEPAPAAAPAAPAAEPAAPAEAPAVPAPTG